MKKNREEKRQELLRRIKGFRLMDDEFMTKCFEDNAECTELVLRIIMDKDANAILPGDDVELLPENYVIFITENDLFETGLPVYHIDRVVKETGKPFGDASHILYVNGAYRGDDPVGRLMHDF